MSFKATPNVVDSTKPEKYLKKCENDEVTQISKRTGKSSCVKGVILADFDGKSF